MSEKQVVRWALTLVGVAGVGFGGYFLGERGADGPVAQAAPATERTSADGARHYASLSYVSEGEDAGEVLQIRDVGILEVACSDGLARVRFTADSQLPTSNIALASLRTGGGATARVGPGDSAEIKVPFEKRGGVVVISVHPFSPGPRLLATATVSLTPTAAPQRHECDAGVLSTVVEVE